MSSRAPAGSPLSGQVAVVTGANSGIGLETARELAARGASVVLACRRLDAAEAAAADIRCSVPGCSVSTSQLDVADLHSVREFARKYTASGRPLHILCNNAGANFMSCPPTYVGDGINLRAQTNFLGGHALERLLLETLKASQPSRVVHVASVMHRFGSLRNNPRNFLTSWNAGTYSDAKLATTLGAYEADRRYSHLGVRSVAVDPGGVATAIWRNTPLATTALGRALVNTFYAPPAEGSTAVVHACTAPLTESGPAGAEPGRLFFARGMFAAPPVTSTWLPRLLAMPLAALSSAVDQPLRALSGGKLATRTCAVRSSRESYDRVLARQLWDAAAEAAGLPRD